MFHTQNFDRLKNISFTSDV